MKLSLRPTTDKRESSVILHSSLSKKTDQVMNASREGRGIVVGKLSVRARSTGAQ